ASSVPKTIEASLEQPFAGLDQAIVPIDPSLAPVEQKLGPSLSVSRGAVNTYSVEADPLPPSILSLALLVSRFNTLSPEAFCIWKAVVELAAFLNISEFEVVL